MSTITGTWRGTYTAVSEDGTEGRTKSFDMVLTEDEDEEFFGEILDTSESYKLIKPNPILRLAIMVN